MMIRKERKVDPSTLNQIEVETYLLDDADALDELTDEYGEACAEFALAEAAYKSKRAKKYVTSRGTNKDREYYAEHVSSEEYARYRTAEERKDSLYQALWTVRKRIEVYQSLNANIRGQVN